MSLKPLIVGSKLSRTSPQARAITDVIDAIFTLAEAVSAFFVTLLRMTIIAFIFITVWLVLLFSGLVWLIASNPTLSIILNICIESVLISIGLVTLILLIQVYRFFKVFIVNHTIIKRLRRSSSLEAPEPGEMQETTGGKDASLPFIGSLSETGAGNTLEAIFELTGRVNEYVPRVKRLLRFGYLFVSVLVLFAGLDLILIGVLPAEESFLWWARLSLTSGLVLDLPLIALGCGAIVLLNKTNTFFDYFVTRWGAIKHLQDIRTDAPIPPGADPVTRYLTYLQSISTVFRGVGPLSEGSDVLERAVTLRGRSGTEYVFDGHISGGGRKAPLLFIKHYDEPPSSEDLGWVERAVRDIALTSKGAATGVKVVLIWTMDPEIDEFGEGLDDEVYDALITHSFPVTIGMRTYPCIFELVIEQLDRTYDFIPYVYER